MSRYSEKVAAREEAARLALLEPEPQPEEPEAQPEPEPQTEPQAPAPQPEDGPEEVPTLDTFTPRQIARYRALLHEWCVDNGRATPNSRARRSLRRRTLREMPA